MRATRRKPWRRQPGRRRGFTLLEAMVVVAIIGMSAALAAPSLMEAMADRRASEASRMVVRIGARARTEALAFGRAHVLVFSNASGSGPNLGSLTLWRGRVDRCSMNDWSNIIAGGGSTAASCRGNPNCVDSLDFGRYDYPTHKVRLSMPGATAGAICFQPDGDSFFATTTVTGTLWTMTPPSGTEGVLFTIDRLQGGAVAGAQRQVVIPFGGSPRVAR